MYKYQSSDNSFDKYDEMRLHMNQLLSTSLLELDLPMRIAIPLDKAGIRHLRDIVCLTRDDLLQVDRIGLSAVTEIEHLLNRIDLSLKKQ